MKDVNLPIEREKGLINKIRSFLRNIFKKADNTSEQITNNERKNIEESIQENTNFFNESIKVDDNAKIEKLLAIQNKIEGESLDVNAIYELTKTLSTDEKFRLKELYYSQISALEQEIQNYKSQMSGGTTAENM